MVSVSVVWADWVEVIPSFLSLWGALAVVVGVVLIGLAVLGMCGARHQVVNCSLSLGGVVTVSCVRSSIRTSQTQT